MPPDDHRQSSGFRDRLSTAAGQCFALEIQIDLAQHPTLSSVFPCPPMPFLFERWVDTLEQKRTCLSHVSGGKFELHLHQPRPLKFDFGVKSGLFRGCFASSARCASTLATCNADSVRFCSGDRANVCSDSDQRGDRSSAVTVMGVR